MITHLTAIGNSRGIRIPSALLRQCGFEQKVELRVRGQQIIISPAHKPRAGWDEALAAVKPQPLLMDDAVDLDMEDWDW